MHKKTNSKKIKSKIKSKAPVHKTGDLPVTQSMLSAVHKQIKSQFNSTDKKIEALDKKIEALDKKIEAVEKRLEAKINQVEAKIIQVESKIELVLSEIHRMAVLMEEQNSRNKFVLDGYSSLFERQDRLEQRFDTLEKNIENVLLKR